MKSTQQHTILSSSFLVILCGILFCSFFPLDKDSDEYKYSHHFQYETAFDAVIDADYPDENNARNSITIFELVLKETAEEKNSSSDTNGIAVSRQALNYIEVVAERFYPDGSILYKSPQLLSKEYSSDLVNPTSHHFSATLLSLIGTIAINAP